ncbi:carbohydrate ABC transporter permease [Mesotoga sp. B105.6.4]|uniref:carbohydrate ABC transporter permease n=1 Tax=Mesotoga sp. B105.6.4 TaxID=1582224 RepID=UPI000CCC787D|nr:carbohydrate ABC transporter permease [Mesotoga sp. B105.6.4]
MRPKRSVVITMNIVAFVVVLLILSPLLMLVLNSFRETMDIYQNPLKLPEKLYTGNYSKIFQDTSFRRNFANSMTVTLVTVLLCIVITMLAGYAMSRFKFKGKNPLILWLLASQAFPGILMIIGLFSLLNRYSLQNNPIGLIILYTTFTIPFCSWLLKGYFDEIPQALEEAAMIDGCTRFQAMRKIIVPMAVPGIVAVGTFAFLLSWNEFFFALVIMRENANYTLPVFLSRFVGTGGAVEWGALSAGALITALPPILLFLLSQKYLIGGLTRGAVK